MHDPHKPPHHAGKDLTCLVAVADHAGFGIEEHNDVDIGRIIELARAMLAHAKHDQAGTLARIFRIRQGKLARLMPAAQQMIKGCTQGCVGKIAQRRSCVSCVDQPGQIMQRERQGNPPFGPA